MTDAAADPRAVWITGAASGMGAAHARRFAAMGDRVACWDLDEERLGGLVAEIRDDGGTAEPVVADVSDWAAVEREAGRVRDRLGPAQVVVANAGIIPTGEHLEQVDPADFRRVVEINLTGCFLTAKAAAPQLREGGGGRLILISSICGLTASAGFGAYNASKHGVIGLMRTLVHELAPDDVTVNAICPGWIRTPMFEGSFEAVPEAERDLEAFTDMHLIDRLIEPEEVTDAVVWLASPAARTVTGVALPVDAGLMETRAWP